MFVGYYKCDKCGEVIDDVSNVRRCLVNGQYSTEDYPKIAKEYLAKKEFCKNCAAKFHSVIKDWIDTSFEDLEKRRTIVWVYTKDKLPEVPEEGDPNYFVAVKETKAVDIWKLSEIIEDQKEKDPNDEESKEGPHLIYAWADMLSTPVPGKEPENYGNNVDPERPNTENSNTKPEENP